MRRSALPPSTPSAAQLDAICRRKDDIAEKIREDCHETWAISWLAMHAQDSGRPDFTADKNAEALRVALEHVVSRMEAAKSRLDGPHSAALYEVMNEPEDAP